MASIAILAVLALIGWLIYRAVKGKPFKPHTIAYAISVVTGILTLAFFLDMNIPQLVKVVVSILLGIALIILAAYLQLRRRPSEP